ncbi:tetratricopeptide repeat-containing protein [Besnoitia besnoiti]|uniref:Tetratricopeptide repeat-containing protein n=1 Tax=Besnoitia besnoiti TaxID=94643 RepID=A0A2A9M4V1_BESBE|nr:tetratricopeptide repeat-containing protein [Besnoitia besnoiti]PFH31331.1 tetratricopeptide repeat-containing protein [Besnoitia besnoiti]
MPDVLPMDGRNGHAKPTARSSGSYLGLAKGSAVVHSPASSPGEQAKQQLTIDLHQQGASPCGFSLGGPPSVTFSLLDGSTYHECDGVPTSSSASRGTPCSIRSAPTPQLGKPRLAGGSFASSRSSHSRFTDGRSADATSTSVQYTVGSLIMPDGVTVRPPPKTGISSGDPVATHTLRRRTANLNSDSFSSGGPFSTRLNLSLHRRSLNTTWQKNFRYPAATGGSRRRVTLSRHLNPTGESLPRLVAFSPSLNRALIQDTCLTALLRAASDCVPSPSSQHPATSASEPPPCVSACISAEAQHSPDSALHKDAGGAGNSFLLSSEQPLSPPPEDGKSLFPLAHQDICDAAAGASEREQTCEDPSHRRRAAGIVSSRLQDRGKSPSPSGSVSASVLSDSSKRPTGKHLTAGDTGVADEGLPRRPKAVLEADLMRETKKCEEQLAANPENEDVIYQLGILKFRAGRAEEAICLISDFIQQHAPKRPGAACHSTAEAALNSTKTVVALVDNEAEIMHVGRGAKAKQQCREAEPGKATQTTHEGLVGGAEDAQECGAQGESKESSGDEPGEDARQRQSEETTKCSEEEEEDVGESSLRCRSKAHDKQDACRRARHSGGEESPSEGSGTKAKDDELQGMSKSIMTRQDGNSSSHSEEPGQTGAATDSVKEEQLDWRLGRAVPVHRLFNLVLDRPLQIDRRAKDLLMGWGPPMYLQLEKLLGHLWFEAENYSDAVRHYWRCIDLSPDNAQLFTNLGLAYYEMDAMKEAAAAFEQAIKLDEKDVTALSVLAMLLMDEFAEAEEEKLREMEEREDAALPNEEERLRNLREGTQRCVAMLQKCLHIDENNILARLHLAQVYMYREEWKNCEEIFQALLQENPDDTHILNNLGQVALHKGDQATAFQHLQRVLKINPEDELAHMHLCELLCKTNQTARALEHFRLCCQSSPDSVSLHATCGLPLCEVGKEKEVIAAYTEFIKAHPQSAAAKTFKRSLGSMSEDVGFSESTTIVSFIVLPILLLLILLLGCAHFLASWSSPAASTPPSFPDGSFHSEF